MKLLDICRTDKAKPVREAAMETLKMMKELAEAPEKVKNNYDLSFEKSEQSSQKPMDSEVDELSMIMEPDEQEKKTQAQK